MNPQAPKTYADFVDILVGMANLLIPIMIAAGLLVFFWGVARVIGSGGNEDAVQDGKHLMFWGVIALFVMLSFWGIVSFLFGDIFGGDFVFPFLPV